MECEKYIELISTCIDGEAGEEEKGLLQKHLGECENCRALYESLKIINSVQKQETVPEGLAEGAMRIINAEKKMKKHVIYRFAAAAAVFAVIIFASAKVSLGGSKSADSADTESAAPEAIVMMATAGTPTDAADTGEIVDEETAKYSYTNGSISDNMRLDIQSEETKASKQEDEAGIDSLPADGKIMSADGTAVAIDPNIEAENELPDLSEEAYCGVIRIYSVTVPPENFCFELEYEYDDGEYCAVVTEEQFFEIYESEAYDEAEIFDNEADEGLIVISPEE